MAVNPGNKARIAIPTGDAAGIGPEVSLKTALDPAVRGACIPIVVSDPDLLARHAKACGIQADLRVLDRIAEADGAGERVNVLACAQPEAATLPFGATDAAGGRAALAFARAAVAAATAGEVQAVVAAPHNETSIAKAGIPFDGYPSFVARETKTDLDDVYLMLCFGETRIVHVTLHLSVRDALARITRDRVERVIGATGHALRQLGIAAPRLAVGGVNPHAGEGGLFGREEIEIIRPAMDAARSQGLVLDGPFGADTMFHKHGYDAFVVMLHDQGHITAKLLAPNATAAVTIGTPILFSSVAHGSAYDIAGIGVASPAAMIAAVLGFANARSA
jgi:4-hydroxythreonine-4-phosphate dehydrogenase